MEKSIDKNGLIPLLKPCLQLGALCYWGLTNKYQLKTKPVASLSVTSIFDL